MVALEFGSRRRARTADPVINSHLLYRLSYSRRSAHYKGFYGDVKYFEALFELF